MIEARNISNSWGTFSLRDVSLSVSKSEYLVILGPCGSGKTVLLETLAGLHAPAAGRVILNGRDLTCEPPERRRIALVYQQYALFPHLSVRANIAYGLRYRGLKGARQRARVEEMLDMLGIRHLGDRPSPAGLSGGEAQMVTLARALAVEPEALLLDEPLSSMDYQSRHRMMDLLRVIGPRLDIPVIHVTHDFHEAASLADRVAVMLNGVIAQTAEVEELFWRPRNSFVAEFLGIPNVYEGECREAGDGRREVSFSGLKVTTAAAGRTGRVAVCFRPEEVKVQTAPGSGENGFRGKVREITDLRFNVRMRVSVDSAEFLVLVPRRSFAALGVTAGSDVYVELPPESVHVMEPGEGGAADAD